VITLRYLGPLKKTHTKLHTVRKHVTKTQHHHASKRSRKHR
jgi:hypothetical protein